MKCEICGKEIKTEYVAVGMPIGLEASDTYYHKTCYDQSIRNEVIKYNRDLMNKRAGIELEVSPQETKPIAETGVFEKCKKCGKVLAPDTFTNFCGGDCTEPEAPKLPEKIDIVYNDRDEGLGFTFDFDECNRKIKGKEQEARFLAMQETLNALIDYVAYLEDKIKELEK